MRRDTPFTLDDFLATMRQMNASTSFMALIPGMSPLIDLVDVPDPDGDLRRVEALLLSMTPMERHNAEIINGSRAARIARGSGTSPSDVIDLVREFVSLRDLMEAIERGRRGRGHRDNDSEG